MHECPEPMQLVLRTELFACWSTTELFACWGACGDKPEVERGGVSRRPLRPHVGSGAGVWTASLMNIAVPLNRAPRLFGCIAVCGQTIDVRNQ